ncbi:hypothetical protein JANAI62_33380 [Jannaschia pagri]|uniref:3-methyladenine DNA glycosylase AlkD n=1 Tax=Jannaschia pagri TaxID=2829797 RepID=A0ABQ4NQP5_9RHOB|nr:MULTISPECIES: DNA alkylation repair protein [unclassified Jannaschia]GIT92880.1 hypothetical protein JANAI61_33380 [Jannaschia sp. AI_61]GIT96715.1 hypothetical protein JANAI62_33380 [Jannaschia sp. AI_62]
MTDGAKDGGEGPVPRAPWHISGTSKNALLEALRSHGDADRAARDQAANRTTRETWGLSADVLGDAAKAMRDGLTVDRRVLMADALWREGVVDTRVLAAKVLTQARIRPDGGAWSLLERWVFDVDCRVICDAVAAALSRRLVAEPGRLDVVAGWTEAASPWARRLAFEGTRPWAKLAHPKEADVAVRERVLAWAHGMSGDARPLIRQAIEGWLRDLAKRDPARVAEFRELAAE